MFEWHCGDGQSPLEVRCVGVVDSERCLDHVLSLIHWTDMAQSLASLVASLWTQAKGCLLSMAGLCWLVLHILPFHELDDLGQHLRGPLSSLLPLLHTPDKPHPDPDGLGDLFSLRLEVIC